VTLIDGRAESGERNDSSGATEEGSGAGGPFSLTNSRDAQICAESGGMASNLPPGGEHHGFPGNPYSETIRDGKSCAFPTSIVMDRFKRCIGPFSGANRVIREPQTTSWGEKRRLRASRYNEASN